MEKKTRIGTDPLRWIRDSSEDEQESEKQSLPSKQSLHQSRKRSRRMTTTASQVGLPEGWTRATFIVQEDQLEKIKALAYWERKQIKEIVREALESYLTDKNIEPMPDR